MKTINADHPALRASFGQRAAALAAAAAMCLVIVAGTLGVAATYTGEADRLMARLWPPAQAVAKGEGGQGTDERCVRRARPAEPSETRAPSRGGSATSCGKDLL
jgi:hypothetical protein